MEQCSELQQDPAAKLTQLLSLCPSGLVLVMDAIAGMGLAPGRHTLGQQVVEIDGLNTEYSVLFTQVVG